ncbi:DUF4190 domain-containing protein [Streptomyces lavendofoliae]|uniref:DUF4190 domain-containing protein n=1 Tax=Streptomyces lavendofoliae TaxID=67314 RepID=UPI003D902B08
MPETSDANDPWAPPSGRPPQDRVEPPPHQPPPRPPGVHDQPTMTSVPGAGPGGELPPPPMAPGGPGTPVPGPYGYPAPAPPAGAYGYPGHPAATQPAGAYGYPGYPGYGTYAGPGWQQAPSNGLGVTALVLGIISVVLFCLWGLGVVLGVLALVFGVLGRKKAQRGEADNHGVALAGIILGAVGIVVGGAFLAAMIWTITTAADRSDQRDERGGDSFDTSLVVTSHR